MKKVSVWLLFALSSFGVIISSFVMMWLAENFSRAWDTPSVIAFIVSFILFVLSVLTKHEKSTIKLKRTKSLRERKNNSAN